MSDRTQMVIALIGAGEMGAAVGARLKQHGARVLTSLKGRSGGSEARVLRSGLEVIDDDLRLVRDADVVLSIVPPGAALEVAERFRVPLQNATRNPIFADCNAISPATARRIGQVLIGSRCRYVDAGIIGGPPPADRSATGPRFYASGDCACEFARLAEFGLDIAVLDGPIGAASGLKLSYAGITKGLIAVGSAMIAAAARDGLADALRGELARSQPQILARLERQVPAMLPKAYRWVAEMEQIAEFLGGEDRGSSMYLGAARLYERIAAELERGDDTDPVRSLRDFCATSKPSGRS